MEIGWICTEILGWRPHGQSRSFVSEFHREDERRDFQLGAPSFKLVGVGGGEGRGAQISASSVPLYIYTYDSE